MALIFQRSSKITTIGAYNHEYIFHYQFQFGKHEAKLENTRLTSHSTSKFFGFGEMSQFIFITGISIFHYL